MSLLPFGVLRPFRPRRFLPDKFDAGQWLAIAQLLDRLDGRLASIREPVQLEVWLLDWSELSAALEEESSRRYIAMTCHTEDPSAERAYLEFIREIEPRLKPRQFALSRGYLAHPQRPRLDRDRYLVFDRDNQVRVELYRDDNVPLETEEAELGQEYQKLMGSLTVQFRGEERTLTQMARYLETPERATRQEAWELAARRRLEEADKLEDLFDRLLNLRRQIATNAGFSNYRDYAFRALCRFDYTPADCVQFQATIERLILPLVRAQQARRCRQLGLDRLRPWDLAVDPLNRPPLHPFGAAGELIERAQAVFDRLDSSLGEWFATLRRHRLLDLENRKGKAPGGYQSTLAEARLPFIFMNSVGLQRDVETLLHEAGHAFHTLAVREEDLLAYRNPPVEFCEVASMSMELLGHERLDAFYNATDLARARRQHLEGVLDMFAWVATVDAFQHWLYTRPAHSRSERQAAWLSLMDRFGGLVDWSGQERARALLWHRQLHIFLNPFYYIEYAIAQLGALQVWANARQDPASALAQYRGALRLGGSRPLPELFAAAGCRLAFDAATVHPLVALVQDSLSRLDR